MTPGAPGFAGCPGAPGCTAGAPGRGASAGDFAAPDAAAGFTFFFTSTGWNCTWFFGAFTWFAGTILLVIFGAWIEVAFGASTGFIVCLVCLNEAALSVGAALEAICRFSLILVTTSLCGFWVTATLVKLCRVLIVL